jgi:hypothetical protein
MAEKSFGIKQINMIGVGTPAVESSDDLIINTNGSERIRILGGGDVGIGTTNPSNLLHIDGETDQLKLSDGSGSFEFRAGNVLIIKDNGTERLRIHSTGYAEFSSGAITRVLLDDDATVSGTSVPYDGIPSWATKITLLFDRVSTTGGSEMIVQLGTSGGAITSGYVSGSCNSTGTTIESATAGFVIFTNQNSHNHTGKVEIQRAGTSNKWISNHMIILDTGATRSGSGVLTTYSGTIDRVVLTTEGGSQTFDNGSVTVYYEA